jgi:hypothetical protein
MRHGLQAVLLFLLAANACRRHDFGRRLQLRVRFPMLHTLEVGAVKIYQRARAASGDGLT